MATFDMPASRLGMGCWAIGGPFSMQGMAVGWGPLDRDEARRAVERAVELGVTLFDTADAYGTGDSETLLGEVLCPHRGKVAIATKGGYVLRAESRELVGTDASPAYLRRACEASLRRLRTDCIDLYQLHIGKLADGPAREVQALFEDLVREGKIRGYGWSTDLPDRPSAWASSAGFRALQFEHNVLAPNRPFLALARSRSLVALCRGPLAMGLLGGRYGQASQLGAGDIRTSSPDWLRYFRGGRPDARFLARLDAVRELLRTGGRTLAQGALGWIWASSPHTVPIPGFRTVAQVADNAGATAHGPLPKPVTAEIDRLLADDA